VIVRVIWVVVDADEVPIRAFTEADAAWSFVERTSYAEKAIPVMLEDMP
jgi:hypothetical protein